MIQFDGLKIIISECSLWKSRLIVCLMQYLEEGKAYMWWVYVKESCEDCVVTCRYSRASWDADGIIKYYVDEDAYEVVVPCAGDREWSIKKLWSILRL